MGLEQGLVLIKDENDVNQLKAYARDNNNCIDVYLKHDSELLGWVNFGDDVTNDDVDDWLMDYDLVDSEYSVSDGDDTNPKNVDEGVIQIREGLGLSTDKESSNDSACDDLDSLPSGDDDDFEVVLERKQRKKKVHIYKYTDNP